VTKTSPVNRRNMHVLLSVCSLRGNKQTYMKLKHTNSILEYFKYISTNIIKNQSL